MRPWTRSNLEINLIVSLTESKFIPQNADLSVNSIYVANMLEQSTPKSTNTATISDERALAWSYVQFIC